MPDYFVGTFGQATSLIAKLNTMMGYPNQASGTLTYAKPREHASNPGTWMVIIKRANAPKMGRRAEVMDINAEMSGVERGKIMTQKALEAEGAFPVNIE